MANKGGRPTKFKNEYIDEAKELYLLGYEDKQVAKHFKVHLSTLEEWKVKHKEFREIIKDAKARHDNARVEDSLFKRAVTGYKVTEVKVEEDHEGRKKITRTTREIPADTRASIHWLNNRDPKRWQNTSKVAVEVNDSPLNIQDLYTTTQKNKN